MKYIKRETDCFNTYEEVKRSWQFDALKFILDEFLLAWNYFKTS